MLREIKMKILSLFPFLVSSLCPCKFNENGIQLEFTGSKITIISETHPSPRFQIDSFPARTFSTVEFWSEEFGLIVNRTQSDCMIFNVFGKVRLFYIRIGQSKVFRKSIVKKKIKKSHQVMSSSTVMQK